MDWLRKPGGRMAIVLPTPLQMPLSRGHRWLAMLESGEAKSLKEIATREGDRQ